MDPALVKEDRGVTLRLMLLPAVLLFVSSDTSPSYSSDELGIVRIKAVISENTDAYFTGAHIGGGWILTCGHCCESKSRSVQVRILSRQTRTAVRSVKGVIVCHDSAADIGFIRLERHHGLRTAYKLAPRNFSLDAYDEVVAFDWRDRLGQEQLYSINRRITGINVYVAPDNIETAGMPKDGASGGPLILAGSGRIVGVTTAANVDDGRGIHTGLRPIYRLLERCQRDQ